MAQRGLLNQTELKYFYDTRKKFDQVISDIMGPDVHLHDVSDSDHEIEDFLHQGKKAQQKKIINQIPPKKVKFDDYQNSFEHEDKKEIIKRQKNQLYREKNRRVDDQNKVHKSKAQLWDKTKTYISEKASKTLKLRASDYGSSDSLILQEFLQKIDELMLEKSNKPEENYLNQLLIEERKKSTQKVSQIYKLKLEKGKLEKQLEYLREKSDNFLENRTNEIRSQLDDKLESVYKDLFEKRKENSELREKINKIERDSLLSSSKIEENKKRSISFGEQEALEMSLLQEKQQIKKLKQNNENLLSEIQRVKKINSKLKKIIKLAKNLNDEFMLKLESTVNIENRDTFQNSPSKEYFESSLSKNFHLKNSQFKFIKEKMTTSRSSKSLKKEALRIHDKNF